MPPAARVPLGDDQPGQGPGAWSAGGGPGRVSEHLAENRMLVTQKAVGCPLAAPAVRLALGRLSDLGMIHLIHHLAGRNRVVTTTPQVTSYLVEHSTQVRPEPFPERLIGTALEIRAQGAGTALAGQNWTF